MDRLLVAEFPGFAIQADYVERQWMQQTNFQTEYRPIAGLGNTGWVNEQTLDLTGYLMQDLTTYFRQSFEQRSGASSVQWTAEAANPLTSFAAGYFESILIDRQENIYEGSRSNFFWVKNNTIFTKEKNILPGITRQIILKNYSSNICYDTLNVKNLNYINEAFITQTSRGVIPVKQINNISIGRSSPGEKTTELMLLYNQWSDRINK